MAETLTFPEFLALRPYLAPVADDLRAFIQREQPGVNGHREFGEWLGLYLDWCKAQAKGDNDAQRA